MIIPQRTVATNGTRRAHNLGIANFFNISTRRIGGLRFVKVGRFCFSFCVTAEYKALR